MLSDLMAERIERNRLRTPRMTATDERRAAFHRLVGGKLDDAYRLAAVILGDRLDAEDAVNDAAESAWRHWADLRDPARFEAWFGRILVNTCRDRLRRRGRRRNVEVARVLFESEHPMVGDASDDVALHDLIGRAFERLSLDERIVVALRFGSDMTVPAIAVVVNVPEGTVKSRLHHALRGLRAAVSEGR